MGWLTALADLWVLGEEDEVAQSSTAGSGPSLPSECLQVGVSTSLGENREVEAKEVELGLHQARDVETLLLSVQQGVFLAGVMGCLSLPDMESVNLSSTALQPL